MTDSITQFSNPPPSREELRMAMFQLAAHVTYPPPGFDYRESVERLSEVARRALIKHKDAGRLSYETKGGEVRIKRNPSLKQWLFKESLIGTPIIFPDARVNYYRKLARALLGREVETAPLPLPTEGPEEPELPGDLTEYDDQNVAIAVGNPSNWNSLSFDRRIAEMESALAKKRKPRRPTGRPRKNQPNGYDQKIIAALLKHHGYQTGGSIENHEPAKSKDIAELAGVNAMAVTRFFKKKFPNEDRPAKKYEAECQREIIGLILALWNGDMAMERLQPIRDAVDHHPSNVFVFDRIRPAPRPESLLSFAKLVAQAPADDPPKDARYALLAKEPPRFKSHSLRMTGELIETAIKLVADLDFTTSRLYQRCSTFTKVVKISRKFSMPLMLPRLECFLSFLLM